MKALLVILGVGLFGGCTMIHQMMPSQREAARRAETLQELNQRVMRFADEYAGRVGETVSAFQTVVSLPSERLHAQIWKAQQIDAAYTIASGANPFSNALDMVVLATLSSLVIEDVWIGSSYGTRAQRVLDMHRKLEGEAWQLIEGVLTQPQLEELHDIIDRWRKENPNVHSVAYIHFRDFAMSIKTGAAPSQGSLFALFGLDPLAQLDPAVREIAQTRELAERAIFYLQRAPDLLSLQVELLAYQFAVMPETQSLLENFDRASLVGSAADGFVASLPDLVAREREALLSQLPQALNESQATLQALSGDVRSMLQAGTDAANSLNAALESADRIAARFPARTTSSNSPPPSKPFDITEYTEMLRELNSTVRELQALARHADNAMPAVDGVVDSATSGLERIIDRLFARLLILIVVAIVFAWAGAILYRAAVFRMQRAARMRSREGRDDA